MKNLQLRNTLWAKNNPRRRIVRLGIFAGAKQKSQAWFSLTKNFPATNSSKEERFGGECSERRMLKKANTGATTRWS
jgi:hypothetical protein